MAGENDDIDIIIEDDPKAPPAKATPGAEAATPVDGGPKLETKPEDKPQSGLDALKEQRAREAAEARANSEAEGRRRAEMERDAARGEAEDNAFHLITGSIERIKAEQASRKASLKDAMASGDFDTAADLQSDMATAAAALMRMEEGKADIEHRAEQAKKAPPPQAVEDPTEALARQMSQRSATWVRAHPEFTRDPSKYQQLLAAHNLAIARDNAPVDSDEYFDSVERTLNLRQAEPAVEADVSGASQAAGGRAATAPPAAPPSRSGSPSGGSKPTVVRLTAAERDVADACGMSYEDYAKNKVALANEGRITTH